MNKLKPYYAYVGVPIGLLVLGAIVFSSAIMSTVEGNPHPEINYIIFLLLIAGATMMLLHVVRLNREGQLVQNYFDGLKKGLKPLEIQRILSNSKEDVLPVLVMLDGLVDKPITALQHDALEHEMTRFESKQTRRLMLAQYMGGLMVGMGLLGTFIGLLGALSEIGKLIGAFGGGVSSSDPVGMIQELVTRLTAPMQAMGVAFSASLFGVLGSLVMGILLVSVKSCASELVNMVRSRASMVTDFSAPGQFGLDLDLDPLQEALEDLAEKTPALKLMSAALDQSERRVRELVTSLGSLTARLTHYDNTLETLAKALGQRSELDQRVQEGALRQQEGLEQLTLQLASTLQGQGQVAKLLHDQLSQQEHFIQQTQGLLASSSQTIASHAQEQMKHLVETLRVHLSAQYTAMQEGNARTAGAEEAAQKVLRQHETAMTQLQTWFEKFSQQAETESAIRTQMAQRLESVVEAYHSRQEQIVRQWLAEPKT